MTAPNRTRGGIAAVVGVSGGVLLLIAAAAARSEQAAGLIEILAVLVPLVAVIAVVVWTRSDPADREFLGTELAHDAICPCCGSTVRSNWRLCPDCGALLSSEPDSAECDGTHVLS